MTTAPITTETLAEAEHRRSFVRQELSGLEERRRQVEAALAAINAAAGDLAMQAHAAGNAVARQELETELESLRTKIAAAEKEATR